MLRLARPRENEMATKKYVDTGVAFESDLRAELEDHEYRAIFEREYAISLAVAQIFETVQSEMRRKHLTKADVGRRIGRERSSVSRLLNGANESNPNIGTIGDLLYAVGLRAEIKIKPVPERARKVEPLKVLVASP